MCIISYIISSMIPHAMWICIHVNRQSIGVEIILNVGQVIPLTSEMIVSLYVPEENNEIYFISLSINQTNGDNNIYLIEII